ncbi:MAG: hypothetical protein NTY64_09575, partial [Deltaproteobacteria bacterium]|nr:hypothetical protein [Deltaproteobacteria bacterium]
MAPARRIQDVEEKNWARSLAGGTDHSSLQLFKLRLGSDAGNDKLKRFAAAMGEPSMSADAAIQAVARISRKAGLPGRLSEVRVLESGIPKMARNEM